MEGGDATRPSPDPSLQETGEQGERVPPRASSSSSQAVSTRPLPVHFDMETGDPDDAMALVFLASHPRVRLVSVSVFPGSPDQVRVVKGLLQRVGMPDDLPVGVFNAQHSCMPSGFWKKVIPAYCASTGGGGTPSPKGGGGGTS